MIAHKLSTDFLHTSTRRRSKPEFIGIVMELCQNLKNIFDQRKEDAKKGERKEI